MSDCVQKDRTRRVRLFPLDSCDRIILTGNAGVFDFDGFETISFSENVTQGDRETIKTTSGATCRDKVACPTDLGETVTFNECTETWALMAMAGYGTLELSTAITHPNLPVGTVIGFNRCKVQCDAAFALEILFELDGACDDTGNPQCIARLYPKLDRGVLTGDKTINGVNVVRGSYSFTTEINTHLFENFPAVGVAPNVTHPPTGELSYWAPWIDDIETNGGSCFFYERLVDCPTIAAPQACELRAVATV